MTQLRNTFSVAGTSVLNGKCKVRFANDFVGRFKILAKNGHEDINLVELDGEFTKAEICKMLLDDDRFQDEASQDAITDFVVRNCKDIAKELEATKTEVKDAEAELA
jgi:uncharacterized protein YwgA